VLPDGLALHYCAACRGSWLSKSVLERGLELATTHFEGNRASKHGCPACPETLAHAKLGTLYSTGLVCTSCGGAWLSADFIQGRRRHLARVRLQDAPLTSNAPSGDRVVAGDEALRIHAGQWEPLIPITALLVGALLQTSQVWKIGS
jgi:Zn-finger nucleic acid-binding protein